MSTITDWLQVGLLTVNAALIYFYLRATQRIAQTNQEQVKASLAQAKASQEQLEAQIRPAIVFRKPDLNAVEEFAGRDAYQSGELTEQNVMQIHNVGSGPALHLIFAVLGHNQQVDWDRIESEFASPWNREFVPPGVAGGPFVLPSNVFGNRLAVRYESLSGKRYASVVFIDGAGDSVRTEFLASPASRA